MVETVEEVEVVKLSDQWFWSGHCRTARPGHIGRAVGVSRDGRVLTVLGFEYCGQIGRADSVSTCLLVWSD